MTAPAAPPETAARDAAPETAAPESAAPDTAAPESGRRGGGVVLLRLGDDAGQAPPGAATVRAERCAPFAAEPPGHCPQLRRLRELLDECQELRIRSEVTPAGAPGAVLNALIALGGPAYGRDRRHTLLRPVRVRLDLTGPVAGRERAARQLTRLCRALGARAFTAARAPAPVPGPDRAPDPAAAAAPPRGRARARAADRPSGPARALDMSLGAVELPHHHRLTAALARAAGAPSRYCEPHGAPELLRELRRRAAARRDGAGRAATVTVGASAAISATLLALLEPGAAVLVPDPGYPPYRGLLARLGLRAVDYPVPAPGRPLRAEHLAGTGAAAVLWNSPHNPTGWVAGPADVAALCEVAEAEDLLVISDEVYRDLIWHGTHHSPAASPAADRTVVVDSVSKRFAAAGLRIGWADAPERWTDRIAAAHWQLAMSPSLVCQHAAARLLADAPEVLGEVREHLRRNRERCAAALAGPLPGVRLPDGACYLWLTGHRADPERLRRATGVRVTGGPAFGPAGRGAVRLSLGGPPRDVAEGVARVARALANGPAPAGPPDEPGGTGHGR